jgi:hypothetical protein
LLGVVAPLCLAALVLVASQVHRGAGQVLHGVILVAMGSLLAISVIRLSPLAEQTALWVPALVFGVGLLLAWSYYRLEWARTLLSAVAVAPLAVTGAFLFLSPSGEVAWGIRPATGYQSASVGAPAPVVMLVFDEFPIASVIGPEGDIQEEHFPALAELASGSTWFRNAVATQQATRDAMPALLTGLAQVPGAKLPHYADHPSSIFTLLGADYEVQAIETLTQVCPPVVCSEGSRDVGAFGERWAALGTDLGIVTGHLLLPEVLSSDLPPIDQNWGDFAPEPVERPEKWSIRDRMQEQVSGDRRTQVARFLAGLERTLEPTEFHFVHLPLPHRPWTYLADGRAYLAPPGIPGTESGGWGDNEFLVEQAYQRHLLQTQYADSIIGEVIGRLRSSGSYEQAIVVIAADHGVAVRPGFDERSVRPETVGDIAAIPLFIKAPGQREGAVDDYRVTVLDIVPTIAGLIDAEIPWKVDGIDLFGPNRPRRTHSTMAGQSILVEFGVDGEEKYEVVAYHRDYFGDRGPYGLAPIGYSGLLGQSVGDLDEDEGPISARLDSPEMYADVDPEADPLPALVTGRLEGASPGQVLAVAVGSRIVAITEAWEQEGSLRFQAMLPADALRSGRNEFGLYVVSDDLLLTPVHQP